MSRVFEVDPTGAGIDFALEAAAGAVAAGELVVMPTETVPGIAARPDDPAATARLFEAKRRPADLNLPVLAATAEEALALADDSATARTLAGAFWPGPLTLVLPRSDRSAAWSLGSRAGTIGVRVPDHPVALALLRRTGPLAVTSANPSGEPPIVSADELVAAFGEAVAVYLIELPLGAPGASMTPAPAASSTVVDLCGRGPRVLRAGPIDETRLLEALA